ncbi:PIR Superfamily Protein [Plasmodium ovale wallikeri]|uniref:PIR Superfamily Protein n=1 Tax=Plasmodium ovale wallikeri TaxID=864142 RepID=A0A1A9A487_PLAOA|nr:PIR Superfamily Protein [Plasmodium ovale wallikeri]SBT58232.1 PIR Superfamily Protein [Plasmodium ovale wallikeri]
MSEVIAAEALKLLKVNALQENSYLVKFYEKFSLDIKNAYTQYEKCIEENGKKKEAERNGDSNIICNIDKKNAISLDKHQEEFKRAHEKDGNSCDNMLYWMSDQIEECKYNTHCTIWLYNMFWKFWENSGCCIKKQVNIEGNCKETFMIEFDVKALKNKKELNNFLEYYKNIENALKEEDSEKKETYCKYVKYMFDLYHLMDKENVHKKYAKELHNFEHTFNTNDKLSKLKESCNNSDLSVISQREERNRNVIPQVKFKRFIPDNDYLYKNGEKDPKEMNDILKDTPSYNLYEEFDSEVTEDTNNKYCTDLFKEQSNNNSESIKICKQIIKNFEKLYQNEIKTKANNRCLHYKNWVYQKIWELITTKSEYENAEKIIKKFMEIQTKKNIPNKKDEKICHYYFNFKDFIELNAKKEEKDLHDYFKNYDFIETKVSPNTQEKEKYINYLKYIYKLYKRHKSGWNCCHEYGVDPLCAHYFKCEVEYNPNDLIDVLNGTSKDDIRKKYKDIPVVRVGERKNKNVPDEKNIMRIQHGRCSRIYDPDDKTKVISLRCDYQASLDHFKNFHEKLPDGKKKDDERAITSTSISPVRMSDSSDMSNMEEELNPVSYKIPTSVALGLGTAFTFFLYYRFTPFGSLFGNRSRGKISFEDDFNEEYMAELYDGSEYEDVNPRNRRIHIAYQ